MNLILQSLNIDLNIILTVVVNTVLMVLVLIIYLQCQKFFKWKLNHVVIFSVVWGALIIGSQILGWVELCIEYVIYFYLIWIIFILGSIIPMLFSKRGEQHYSCVLRVDRRSDKIILYIFTLLLFFYIAATIDLLVGVFFQGFTFENWADIRKTHSLDELRDGNWFYTLFGTNVPILVPLMTYLYFRKGIGIYTCLVIFLYFLMVAVVGFTRAPLLALLMVLIISIRYMTDRKISPAFLILPMGLIGLFFGLSSFYLNSLSIDWSFYKDISVYFFGGIHALVNIMNGIYFDNLAYDVHYYSFDFILYPMKILGIINNYPSLVREYDTVLPTNVYTFLDCFILDFGLIGGLIGTFFIGVTLSMIYKSIKYFGLFGIMIYSTFIYFTAFVFMNNEFIRFGTILFTIKVILVFICFKLFYFLLKYYNS